ncbi:MAG: energy-coupled thiamine transporter ThiT, partial [Oscillospiraceae bacterium]|nr:energy-coupled thiamine transporter ThiT [Oscillospiraceae bacterium]
MKNAKLKTLVEGAIMIALATVLSLIKIYKLPWGGSITLLSMLPIAVFSLRHGVYKGLGVSFVYALIQLFQGIVFDGLFAWGLTPLMLIGCIMLDYILPFTSLGLSGIFKDKGLIGQLSGITIAI